MWRMRRYMTGLWIPLALSDSTYKLKVDAGVLRS